MVETADKTTLQESPDKSDKSSDNKNLRSEILKLYDSAHESLGKNKNDNTSEHIAFRAAPDSNKTLPDGGIAEDGSLVFRGDKDKADRFAPLKDGEARSQVETKPPLDKGEKPESKPGVVKDDQGRVTEVTYPNGQSREFGYGAHGELNRITQPDGRVIIKDGDTWRYQDGGGKPNLDDAKGKQGRELAEAIRIIGNSRVPDIIDPKVGDDGTLTYSSSDGGKHEYKPDGTSAHQRDGATYTQDINNHTTSIQYANGETRSFGYDKDGQLNKVTDTNGKTYTFQEGRWVGADGKPAQMSNIRVEENGDFSFINKDGQNITPHLDRTSDVENANGSRMHRDADGHVTEVTSSNGKVTRKFEYNDKGQLNSITEADGTVVTRGADGKWSDGRTDVTLSNDGTLQYTNKDGHIVLAGTDGQTRTSSKSAEELRNSAEAMHTLLDNWLLARVSGGAVNSALERLSPTDRYLLAQEYEKKYGHSLGEDLGKLNDGSAADAQKLVYTAELQEYANRNIPDAPGSDGRNQRQAFMDNMNEFLNRAERDHLSDQEVAKTLQQVMRLGDANNALVNGQERSMLVQQIMHNAAHPDQINQGQHLTCNVTDVEMLAFTRNPSVAAQMIADAAITGEWTAPDGKKIKIPPQNLVPDAEARANPPDDGRRGFADQIFQAVSLNDVGQRETPPKYFASRPPEGGADVGDFWTDENGKPLLREKKDKDGNVVRDDKGNPVMEPDRFGGLGYHEINDEVRRLTGQEHAVIVSWNDGKLLTFDSEDELRNIIVDAQENNQMPLIIGVTGDDTLFGGSTNPGDKDRGVGNHVVVIRDYNPTTGMVRVDNSWGESNDKWVPLAELYNASR